MQRSYWNILSFETKWQIFKILHFQQIFMFLKNNFHECLSFFFKEKKDDWAYPPRPKFNFFRNRCHHGTRSFAYNTTYAAIFRIYFYYSHTILIGSRSMSYFYYLFFNLHKQNSSLMIFLILFFRFTYRISFVYINFHKTHS